MAFITAETRSDLIELSVAMLKQAPSAALLEELIALSVGGGSLADAADHIGKTAAFKAEYPSFQTAEQYAAEIFDNITTGGTITADLRTAVIELATGMLTSGSVTKSGLALAIAEYLAAPAALLNEDFADIAQSFQNRADAAEYFVVNKELGASTDAELAAAIASVTSDAATLTAANTAADATSTAVAVVAGKTLTLTTAAENIVGSAGDDSFVSVVNGAGVAGTTILAGDVLNGGEGTDTLTVSTAGAIGGTGYTVAAIQGTSIENLMFNAYDTDAQDLTMDLTLFTDLQKVGTNSGSATGDLVLTGARSVLDMAINNMAGDVTMTYPSAVVSVLKGDQTQNIAVSGVTGQVSVAGVAGGVEIVNVDSTLVASTLSDLVIDTARTLNITGDANLTITATVDMANTTSAVPSAIDGTVDASALTGKLNFTPAAADNMKITGGSANDTINMAGGQNGFDVIDGGDGIDTITLNSGFAATAFAQTTNVEVTAINAAAAAITADASKTAGSTLVLNLRDAADNGAKLTSTISKVDGKTVSLAKTADAADAANDDGVILNLTDSVDSADDTINVTLNGVGTATSANGGYDTLGVAAYETVNITANKSAAAAAPNEIINLVVGASTSSINIDGTGNFTTALGTGAKVTSVDASGLAGALVLTASAANATYKMGGASSTLTMAGTLNSKDTIVGGAGVADTVTATVAGMSPLLGTSAVNISDVERIYLTTSAANTIDMSAVTGAYTLAVTDNKQTITGFDLSNTLSLGLAGDEAATSSEIDVTAADATGTDDTLSVTLENTNGAVSSIIDASGIENLALKVVDDTQGITLDMRTGEFNAITIAMKDATDNGAVDLGTVHKNTTSITSGSIGAITASFAAQVAPNGVSASYSGLGVAAQTITGGSANDTFTIGTTGAITHAITGGGGTGDTTNITTSAAFVNAGSINTENVNVSVVAGADVTVTTAFHAGVDAIVLTGGNSLSTFTTGTLNAALKTIDASGFTGNIAATIAADALDTTVTVTGGPLATDTLSNTIATGATTYAAKTSGIEAVILDVNATSTVSMGLSDAAQLNVDVAAAGVTATVTSAEDTLVRVTAAAANSDVTVSLADSTGSADTVALELDEAVGGALVDAMDINVADVETVSIKVDDAVSVDLSGLSMTTAGKTMGLTLTGLAQLGISALGTDVTTIDASGKLAGGVVQTGRTTTGKVEYTGGRGADTFVMTNLGDTMVGGAGTDTLDLNYSAILGGINVDLTSTTNQIASANGGSISGSVTGFESVDLAGYTGTFGAMVTSGSSALTGTTSSIVGTANADQINGGSGADTIDGGAGATVVDVLVGGSGNDVYAYSAVANLFTGAAIVDTITEAASGGTDSIRLDSTGVAFTIPNTDDFGAKADNIEQITVVASANAYSISLKADADTDAAELRTIDLSADTTAGGTNVVNLSLVTGAYTVTGGAGIDQITGSGGADTITGGLGADVIVPGAGIDSVVLTEAVAAVDTVTLSVATADRDNITGFATTSDKLVVTIATFDGAVAGTPFATVGAGGTAGGEFATVANAAALATSGTVAGATDAQGIIHLQDTGDIYLNADGATAGGLILIGNIGAASTLAATDFTLV